MTQRYRSLLADDGASELTETSLFGSSEVCAELSSRRSGMRKQTPAAATGMVNTDEEWLSENPN
jgi:hypothetical protein